MEQDALNRFEKRGLPCAFSVTKAGGVMTAQGAQLIRDEIAQVGMIIFETIGALGDMKINRIEMLGDAKGVLMELAGEQMFGSIFNRTQGMVIDSFWTLLGELKRQYAAVIAPAAEPKEKRALYTLRLLDRIREIMKGYVGDFTERIFKNQLKSQRLNVDELKEEDIRRFIDALGKAATMIIGPSKGREMKGKLLKLLK